METLDRFFDELKENIVPMLHDAAERSKKVDDSFLTADYPEQAQGRSGPVSGRICGT